METSKELAKNVVEELIVSDQFRTLFKSLISESLDEKLTIINNKMDGIKTEFNNKVESMETDYNEKIEKLKGELHESRK